MPWEVPEDLMRRHLGMLPWTLLEIEDRPEPSEEDVVEQPPRFPCCYQGYSWAVSVSVQPNIHSQAPKTLKP